jgi:hypothetical protein
MRKAHIHVYYYYKLVAAKGPYIVKRRCKIQWSLIVVNLYIGTLFIYSPTFSLRYCYIVPKHYMDNLDISVLSDDKHNNKSIFGMIVASYV